MVIIDTKTGKSHQIEIKQVEERDFNLLPVLTKKRYFFNWKEEKGGEVYKLVRVKEEDILGVISVERIPNESRIHIRLLTVSKENKGSGKEYKNIVGNLITYVAKIGLREYAELACVSFKPKTKLIQHYIDTYYMNVTGITLSIELAEILQLIEEYDHD